MSWKLLHITVYLSALIALTACTQYEPVMQSPDCTVKKVGSVATVTCPDGTSTTITDGQTGATGPQGNTGATGATGSQGPQGNAGTNGSNGTNGTNGTNGSNGHSAAFSEATPDVTACPAGGTIINMGIDLNDDGILEPTEITQVAVLCNGQNGTNGTNGTNATESPFTPVTPIMPCGASSSSYKEVLLGLYGGGILSEFSANGDALNVRNTLLPDGGYYDTDSSECYFNVVTDSSGDRFVTWDGSTANHSGPFHAGSANYNKSTSVWTVSY